MIHHGEEFPLEYKLKAKETKQMFLSRIITVLIVVYPTYVI